jgi:hypothetical protein
MLLKKCLMVGAFLALIVGCNTLNSEPMRTVTANYAPVIVALERFKIQEGHYPRELGLLVPTFIESLPSQNGELRALYVGEDQSFHFEYNFVQRGVKFCTYLSTTKKWGCGRYL